ncbi:MAG: MotA/TolQ/ExbB proton channel family protein [Planctomycetaceae bacterium]|nr:MotA/TolQ/ExbB proton channel family protein [Planctomycetaceae bacterium]
MIGSPDRSKRLAWMVLLLALMAGTIESLWLTAPAVFAQEPEPAAEEEMAAEEPAAPKKAGAKKDDKAAATVHEEPGFVMWVIETGGAIGIFIFLLMGYFVATSIKLFLELQPQVAMPPDLMEDIKQKMEKKDYKGVYQSIKEKDCLFTKFASAGLGELSAGLPEARDAMERVADVQGAEYDKKISMLAVLGTLGPMIGLLGTLKGMMASFGSIASGGEQIKSDEVAKGISEALLLTFEGVLLSVPAIYFFAIFKNRTSIIMASTMLAADEFVRKLASAAKAAARPAAAPGPAVAPPAPKA